LENTGFNPFLSPVVYGSTTKLTRDYSPMSSGRIGMISVGQHRNPSRPAARLRYSDLNSMSTRKGCWVECITNWRSKKFAKVPDNLVCTSCMPRRILNYIFALPLSVERQYVMKKAPRSSYTLLIEYYAVTLLQTWTIDGDWINWLVSGTGFEFWAAPLYHVIMKSVSNRLFEKLELLDISKKSCRPTRPLAYMLFWQEYCTRIVVQKDALRQDTQLIGRLLMRFRITLW